jgi:hypothetical protein
MHKNEIGLKEAKNLRDAFDAGTLLLSDAQVKALDSQIKRLAMEEETHMEDVRSL